jgi:hypothetical protein
MFGDVRVSVQSFRVNTLFLLLQDFTVKMVHAKAQAKMAAKTQSLRLTPLFLPHCEPAPFRPTPSAALA